MEDVLNTSETIRRAMIDHDVETLVRYVAEDYRGSDAGGRLHDRELMLSAYGPGGVTLDLFEVDQLEARGWAETTLLEGIARISGRWQDQSFAHNLRFLDVYVRRDGRWQLVASQSTDIAEP
jgi:hypothetical protein